MLKALNFDNLIIHLIVSYDQNISLIFYVKDGFHVMLVFTLPPRVHCSTKDAYTSEITFLALQPLKMGRKKKGGEVNQRGYC